MKIAAWLAGEKMDLKERDALGSQADSHWYYVSKARMITKHFSRKPRKVLDVGAGLGWFSRWLLENGHAESATCVDPGYEADLVERSANGREINLVRSIEETDADLVLLMDVLEHVDDDIGLLKEYYDKAPSGAEFIITVPAFKFLWSAHDDYLDHRRRYTISMLRNTIREAGGTPDSMHYFFGCIFPAAAAVRLVKRNSPAEKSDMKPVPSGLNEILKLVCRTESLVMKLNRLAGLSVVAKVTKP